MEDVFVIQGLSGRRGLKGSLRVHGAKNAALKAFAASFLFRGELPLRNIPDIEDVKRVCALLTEMGATVSRKEPSHYCVEITDSTVSDLPTEIAKRFRGSIVLTGPVLSRLGEVSFPFPGGCVIGKRPIDMFLDGFQKMGALIEESDDLYKLRVPSGKLMGAEIFFRTPTVTGTETFLMAAVLAEGTTVLKNCALEPEITHLASFLRDSGARISGIGTPTLVIEGGDLLSADGEGYTTLPDRIEAGSFLILAALCAEDMTVENCVPEHLDSLVDTLTRAGVDIQIDQNNIRVRGSEKTVLRAVDIKTHEYPGFPTDLQQPMVVLLTQAQGESLVFETIFEGRLSYTEELDIMGADITLWDSHRVTVKGPTPLKGRELVSPDLRAGLAFLIAATVAKGESTIHDIYNIDRGYEKIEERLRGVGVDIKRVTR